MYTLRTVCVSYEDLLNLAHLHCAFLELVLCRLPAVEDPYISSEP